MTGLDEDINIKKIAPANIDFENLLNVVPDAMVLVDDAGSE